MLRRALVIPVIAAAAALAPACDSLGLGNSLNCPGSPTLQVGSTVQGTLSQGDAQLNDGTFVDWYVLPIEETMTVSINMTSTQIDSYLLLRTDAGALIAQDDDSGGGLDSRIQQSLQRGCYSVGANSFDVETGSYTVSATRQ